MYKQLYNIMFHHFHDEEYCYKSQGSISSEEFNTILDYLQENYNLISAREFYSKYKRNKLLQSDVCLSFDDGLKSQFIVALKELKKRNIEAFFFIYSSIFTNQPSPLEFYRDFRFTKFNDLDDFYNTFFKLFKNAFPKEYTIFEEKYSSVYLSEYPFYTENDKKFRFIRDVIMREEKYYKLLEIMLKTNKYSKKERKNKLLVSEIDLKEINSNGHIVGLHSHTHPTNINELDYNMQYEEYSKNLNMLKDITGQDIFSMSHPVGKYNADTFRVLEDLDIKIGFNSSLSHNNIFSRYEIPREDHINLFNKIISEKI